jgi:hypothetical protein
MSSVISHGHVMNISEKYVNVLSAMVVAGAHYRPYSACHGSHHCPLHTLHLMLWMSPLSTAQSSLYIIALTSAFCQCNVSVYCIKIIRGRVTITLCALQ